MNEEPRQEGVDGDSEDGMNETLLEEGEPTDFEVEDDDRQFHPPTSQHVEFDAGDHADVEALLQ